MGIIFISGWELIRQGSHRACGYLPKHWSFCFCRCSRCGFGWCFRWSDRWCFRWSDRCRLWSCLRCCFRWHDWWGCGSRNSRRLRRSRSGTRHHRWWSFRFGCVVPVVTRNAACGSTSQSSIPDGVWLVLVVLVQPVTKTCGCAANPGTEQCVADILVHTGFLSCYACGLELALRPIWWTVRPAPSGSGASRDASQAEPSCPGACCW